MNHLGKTLFQIRIADEMGASNGARVHLFGGSPAVLEIVGRLKSQLLAGELTRDMLEESLDSLPVSDYLAEETIVRLLIAANVDKFNQMLRSKTLT